MNFLITESQLKLIAESVGNPKVMESVRKLTSFSNKLLNRVSKKYKLNIRLLLTWGPSMAGIVMPLDNFIKSGNFTLDENQTSLILCGVAAVLFYDNSENISKIKEKIKEEGLTETFNRVLEKGKDLKSVFVKFIQSLRISLNSTSEIISYAFLIPIIPDLTAFLSQSQNLEKTITMITARVIASGLVLGVADVLSELLLRATKKNQ